MNSHLYLVQVLLFTEFAVIDGVLHNHTNASFYVPLIYVF